VREKISLVFYEEMKQRWHIVATERRELDNMVENRDLENEKDYENSKRKEAPYVMNKMTTSMYITNMSRNNKVE
jgi:hypothetical protein